MTSSRLASRLDRPRSLRRAASLAAAVLLVLTVTPTAPGTTDAAAPKQRGRTRHAVSGASLTPGGPPAATVSRVDTDQKVIALTFDDGWGAQNCREIAQVLDRYAIPATFFLNGAYIRRNAAIFRAIGARHAIGNHTYSHPDLRGLSNAAIVRQLERNRKTIERITGRPIAPLLRPPYGAYDDRVARVAGDLGYGHIVLWNLSVGDTGAHATERGSAIAALRGGPGSIILMHCGPDLTPKMLPVVIERYACRGFSFATVEELLAGSAGHEATVDCPPLPLPARTHRRPGHVDASPDPGMGPVPSEAPRAFLLRDLPVMLAAWIDRLEVELAGIVDGAKVPAASPPAAG
jgi:peptidoglycan/xylan/chitin deacetylase (PgdA/CDA1 family)